MVNGTLALPSQLGGGTVALHSGALSVRARYRFTTPSRRCRPQPSGAAQSGMTTAIPERPRHTKVLSIGLHARPRPKRAAASRRCARLEAPGRVWQSRAGDQLGPVAECQIPLQDPALSAITPSSCATTRGCTYAIWAAGAAPGQRSMPIWSDALHDGDRHCRRPARVLVSFQRIAEGDARRRAQELGRAATEVRSGGTLGLGSRSARTDSAGQLSRLRHFADRPSVNPRHAELRVAARLLPSPISVA